MADGTGADGRSAPHSKLGEILFFLEASAAEMQRRLEALMRGEGALKGVAEEAAELKKWALLAYSERDRIEKLIRENAGGPAAHEIDFAEARASIGRRLDRLRAAAGAGGVPE